jgi:ubiquitin C-terminal hydrolase
LAQEKKPRFAILRPNATNAAASVHFVRFINLFGSAGGFEFVSASLAGPLAQHQDAFSQAVFIVKNFAENLVQPWVQSHGEQLLKSLLDYGAANIDRNIRTFSQGYLSNFIEAVSVLSLRLKPYQEANSINLGLMISVGVICLKSEILEKQFFGAKLILNYEFGLREQGFEHLKTRLASELIREGILEMIVKGHPSLIAKSAGILKVLIQDNKLRHDHLDLIWGQIGKADSESRTALISLVKDVSIDLSREQIRYFLQIMSENVEDISLETMELLQALKRNGYSRHDDSDISALVNEVLWKMLQSPREVRLDVAKELNKLFVRSVRGEQLDHYLPLMVESFVAGVNKSRNLKLLTKYLKEPSVPFGTVTGQVPPAMIDGCVQELINRIELLARLRNSVSSSAQKSGANDAKNATQDAGTEARKEVKRLLRFLSMFIFPKVSIEDELFTFGHFEQLFDAMFQNGFVERQVQIFVTSYLRQSRGEEFLAKSKAFFEAHLQSLDDAECQDFLPLFLTIFHNINLMEDRLIERFVKFEVLYSANRVPPKEFLVCVENVDTFFGIHSLWGLFRKTGRKWLFAELAKAFVNLYLPAEYNDGENAIVYAAQKKSLLDTAIAMFSEGTVLSAQKASVLLQGIIRREEAQESPVVVSLAQLKDGEQITLFIEKDTKYLKERFKVKIYENETLFDLKKHISAEYKISVERLILLKEDGSKISSFDNFHTLEMMNVGEAHTLLVREADAAEANEVEITNKEGTDFSAKVIQVWREVFEDNSENGFMSPETFAWYTQKVTGGVYCGPHEERVAKVFRRFDPNNTGHLDFEGFLNFYRESAFDSPDKLKVVKQNLQALGYKKDFRLKRPQLASTVEKIARSTRQRLINDPVIWDSCLQWLGGDGCYPGYSTSEIDYISRLFTMLPPPLEFADAALKDPIAFVGQAESLFLLSYKLTILNGLLCRSDFMSFIQSAGVDLDQEKQTAFVSALLSANFLTVLCRKLESLAEQEDNSTAQAGFLSSVGLIWKVLRAVANSDNAEFLDTLNKLGIYNSYKKKGPEKAPEKPAEKPALEFGPTNKDGQKVVERESENREVYELTAIGNMLSHFERIPDLCAHADFPLINETLLQLLSSLNRHIDSPSRDLRVFLRLTAGSLALAVRINPQGFVTLVYSELFSDTIVKGLRHNLYSWRVYFTNLYALLSSQFEEPKTKTRFLKILISNLKAQGKDEFSGLVELACSILAEIGELKSRNADFAEYIHKEFNFLTLFVDFQEQFLAHESKEYMFGDVEDQLMVSYLAFLENILHADDAVLGQIDQETKQKLVHHVFHDCLFQVNDGEIDFSRVKCHSRKARSLAFALLRRLLKDNIRLNIHFMVRQVASLVRHIPDLIAGTAVQSEFDKKFANGFLGIRNLGCVCYMIATLQQFYCTPAFRYGILMATDQTPIEQTEVKGQKIDDNFFHQFQRMLAYLDYSERKDYSPLPFCLSYKDSSGQPLNVMIQQDADEFLKILADKIETSLKKSPFLGILRSVFLGQICNLIKCKGCGYVKTNTEDFFNLSLEIKGMRTIAESLDKLVEPETISDYTCDSCKNKVDISKRALLRSLPNVMFLSLKKMYFDLELLTNVKIHNRYEFPMTLNLKRYMYVPEETKGDANDVDSDNKTEKTAATDALLSDEDYEYKLVGVVIHKGNADYGHYISLINSNRGDPARRDITSDKWFEFDDSRVTWFDLRKFDEDCFGTNEDKEFSTLMSSEQSTSNSAYQLVYDKVKKNDLVFTFTDDQTAEKELLLSNLIDPNDVRIKGSEVHTGFFNLKPYIPEPYKSEILRDNKMLTLEQHLLSKAFTNSIADIILNVKYSFPSHTVGSDGQIQAQSPSLNEERVFAETVLQNVPILISKVYCVAAESDRMMDAVHSVRNALAFLSVLGKSDPSKKDQIDQKILCFYKEMISSNFISIVHAISGSSDHNVTNGLTEYLVSITALAINHFGITDLTPPPPENQSTLAKITSLVHHTVVSIGLQILQLDASNSANIRKSQKLFVIASRLAEEVSCALNFFASHNLLQNLIDLYMKIECSRMNPAEKTLSPMLRLMAELFRFMRDRPNPTFTASIQRIGKVDIILKAIKEDYKFEEFDSLKRLAFYFFADDKAGTESVINLTLGMMTGLTEGEIIGCLELFRVLLYIKDSLHTYRVRMILGDPRLIEGNSYGKDRHKSLVYGLSRELSLKKPAFQYLSPFGLEKGLLEQIVSYKESHENFVMLLIHYLLDFMLNFEVVLAEVLQQPPHNYISGTFFDWFSVYCEHHLKYDTAMYSSFKSEMFTKKLTEIPEKIYALAKLIQAKATPALGAPIGEKKLFATGSNPYVGYVNYYSSEKEIHDAREMWSAYPIFIVGKTLGYRVLRTASLVSFEDGDSLEVIVSLIRVALLPSKPTGQSNLSIPTNSLLSDLSINTYTTLHKEFTDFLGIKKGSQSDYEGERMDVEPIFAEDNEDPTSASRNPKSQLPAAQDFIKMAEPSAFVNADYIIRIALQNSTNNIYQIALTIEGEKEAGTTPSLTTVQVRPNRKDCLVKTLFLRDLSKSFTGLRISAQWKEVETYGFRFHTDDYPNPSQAILTFNEQ